MPAWTRDYPRAGPVAVVVAIPTGLLGTGPPRHRASVAPTGVTAGPATGAGATTTVPGDQAAQAPLPDNIVPPDLAAQRASQAGGTAQPGRGAGSGAAPGSTAAAGAGAGAG